MADDKNYRTMKQFNRMRWLLIIGTIILIPSVAMLFTILTDGNVWYGITVFGVLSILFAWTAIRTFSANPPTKWIPEVMGVYVNELKGWGPTLLPWVSSVTIGYTEMPGGIMRADFEPKEMIPDDRVTVVIPVHLYYQIDEKNPVQVILLGGVEKAAELLRENIDKLLRQWVTHPERGPEKLENVKMTLDRVRRMNNEATNHILEEFAKDDIAIVPSEIPIEALMGYFEGRRLSPREQQLTDGIKDMPESEREELRKAIRTRMQDIDALRSGNKPIRIQSTGLEIRQMVVDNIEADGPSAVAVAKVAEANFNAEIKQIEARALADQATTLKPITTTMDPVQAALILQGNIKQTVTVSKFDASGPLIAMVDGLGRAAIGAMFSRSSGRKEPDNGNDAN